MSAVRTPKVGALGEAQSAANGHSLRKGCNAALAAEMSSRRARQ